MQIEENTVVEACLQRWMKTDVRTKHFCEIYSDWIRRIPDSTRSTVISFLDNFCYYPHEVVNGLLANLHSKLLENVNIDNENTIYTLISSKTGIVNSSNDYLTDYRYANDLSKYTCFSDMSKITDAQWQYIENIVFVDDCSGTSKTFSDFIDSVWDTVDGKNIYYITIHIMEEAANKIQDYADKRNLQIKIIYHYIQNKAFINCPEKKPDFIQTSESLEIPIQHILGFRESESLCAFYNNTPNNTLGIFRCDTDTYLSPFPRRDDKKPSWYRLFRDKKKREEQILHSKIERNKYV